jgi:hypothetical protein
MENHFYFESGKAVTSVLGVGLMCSTMALETGVLLVGPEVERQIQAMVHTSHHAPVPSEPTTNSAISASGNTTSAMLTYSSGTGLTFDFGSKTWTAHINVG